MAHEDLHREQMIEGSSDWVFGYVFAAVFLTIAAWPLIVQSGPLRWWSATLAAGFAIVAQLRSSLLGKAPLLMRRDRAAASYWRPRQPPGGDVPRFVEHVS